jgi:threonine/homoserine/homoserine lactone efflux protein
VYDSLSLTRHRTGLRGWDQSGPNARLVISQTLHYRWRAGNLVALAPLFTDIPIIVLLMVILGRVPLVVLNWLALVGGAFVIYLGIETVRAIGSEVTINTKAGSRQVLLSAVATNFLNPHPYLFWATVGSALLFQSYAVGGITASLAFLISFYALLVGAKLAIALLVSRSQDWLTGRAYRLVVVGSGALLIGLGVLLIWEGLEHIL